MSDIEGKVAREAMSECGQRVSFNAFGVSVARICKARRVYCATLPTVSDSRRHHDGQRIVVVTCQRRFVYCKLR